MLLVLISFFTSSTAGNNEIDLVIFCASKNGRVCKLAKFFLSDSVRDESLANVTYCLNNFATPSLEVSFAHDSS